MILDQIKKAFVVGAERNFTTLYYYFDIHETILIPDYNNQEPLRFYPYAKEALQLITKYPGIVCGLYTCSHPAEIEKYQEFFRENDIDFKYVNENPEVVNTRLGCFDSKPYFNVLFEDKAGFLPEEWLSIRNYFYMKKYLPEYEKESTKFKDPQSIAASIGNAIHQEIQDKINTARSAAEIQKWRMVQNSTYGMPSKQYYKNSAVTDFDFKSLYDREDKHDLPDEPTNIEEDK